MRLRDPAEALAAGARAFLLKGDPHQIDLGLKVILTGKLYVSEGLSDVI